VHSTAVAISDIQIVPDGAGNCHGRSNKSTGGSMRSVAAESWPVAAVSAVEPLNRRPW